jgi:hypothetical protein
VKQAIAVVVAALLLTVGLIVIIAPDGGGDDGDGSSATTDAPNVFETTTTLDDEQQATRDAVDEWQAGVDSALLPLQELAGRYVTDVQSWRDGAVDDDTLRFSLGEYKTDVTATRINVEALEPLEAAPAAHASYVALGALYDAAIDTSTAAIDIPAGPLRDETVKLAQRLRILGDRFYERATRAVDAAALRTAEPVVEDLVPDWTAEELAPAEPLTSGAPPPATIDPAEGGTQPRDAWVEAVAGTGAPTAAEVFDAVRDGDVAALGDLARRLDDAATQLRVLPDPDTPDGVEESARVRLGLLSLAEVARLAHVAALVESPEVRDALRFTASALHTIVTVPAFSPPS